MIERGPQTVNVTARIGIARVSPILLQRSIGNRAAPLHNSNRAAVVIMQNFDQPKVNQLDDAARGDFDVAGFDVAMDNLRLLFVEIFERV
jgi:hypothetical protein